MTCSCPDGARMCKHVAAVLYGIGARFDDEPRLLFDLRAADPSELVASAAARTVTVGRVSKDKRLDADLGSIFGIDVDMGPGGRAPAPKAAPVVRPLPAKRGGPAKPVEPKVAAKRPSSKRVRTNAPPPTITSVELSALGVPSATVQYWLGAGVLERTGVRGLYRRTERTDARLAAHIARRA
jgi:SWIM zinc finger